MGIHGNKIKIYFVLIFASCYAVVFVLQLTKFDLEIFPFVYSEFDLVLNQSQTNERKMFSKPKSSSKFASEIETADSECIKRAPSSLMEQTRRHIRETVQDQLMFFRSQMNALKHLTSNITSVTYKARFSSILQYTFEHIREYNKVLDLELTKLSSLDGWKTWRLREAEKLKNIVRERLKELQNPENCSATPVLVCNLTNPSGFASGVHDVLWCFVKAYRENRRLVLVTSHWHYAPRGWETVFRPLSDICPHQDTGGAEESPWPGENSNKARWIMRALPQDIGSRIISIYGDPLAWWYGQFLQYLLRPNSGLTSFLERAMQRIDFSLPIVGIHVRRTDKVGTEAKAHPLEEYLQHAEEYYQGIELESTKSVRRRVYIATDDPHVLEECHRFQEYECLYNKQSAEMASKIETRDTNDSLWNLLTDIFILSKSNFIVCTLSSGICRLAYELKQGMDENLEDTVNKVRSLDVPHHYAWVTPASRKAIYNHQSKMKKEISFKKGDVLVHKNEKCTVNAAVNGKTANGLIKMTLNQEEIKEGFIPLYKTRKMYQMFKTLTE